jgi:cytochrome c biogenesis protein CcdA
MMGSGMIPELKSSSKRIGQLYPILVDYHGNIIDGEHRYNVDEGWRTMRLEHIRTEKDRLIARIIGNTVRRRCLKCNKMSKKNMVYVALLVCFFLLSSIRIVHSMEPVIVEFLYFFDPCPACPKEIYIHNTQVVDHVESEYGDKVLVERIPFFSEEGQGKREQYHIEVWDQNAIVINCEVVITGYANETYVRDFIDYYLGVKPSPPQPPSLSPQPSLWALLALAFSFGFFETFSPCLIAMLSFVLSYTIGKTTQFREGVLQVMAFGGGFVSAALLLGLTVGLIFLSMPALHNVLMWIVCIFAIIFGFNLLGLLNMPFKTKPLVRKLAKKYGFTYPGFIVLGFLFYFLDPCIAPIFVAMLPLVLPEFLTLIFLVFCLGVMIPFVGIGLLAGSISKLTRSTYRHRSKIRAASGLILITYALYLITFYLFPKLI